MTYYEHDYTLMHKDIPVARLQFDSSTGTILSVGEIYNPGHIPPGIPVKSGRTDRASLNAWWEDRCIPSSRPGLKDALKKLGAADARALPLKSSGLSLSDHYWVRPAGSAEKWEKINFFQNTFSEDMGNLLLGRDPAVTDACFHSPDLTTDGWLPKKWRIRDGKRYLLKGGSGAARQEPYNEVMACRIMERLHIPHVKYFLTSENGDPCCLCEDFLNAGTEFVSAWSIYQTKKKPNHLSVYRHFLNRCDDLEIPDMKKSLDQMIVLDYLIVNEDRHLGNFGVIRDADSLEYLGAAPVFDSGTSLWFDRPSDLINTGKAPVCKPFKNLHSQQIRLVSNFDWIDIKALRGVEEEFRETAKESPFIDEQRCAAVCRGIRSRIESLAGVIAGSRQKFPGYAESTENDVADNISYSG